VDHWNRWNEDYRLTRDLGATAFRMSLEWARIEPQRGRFDDAVLDGYRPPAGGDEPTWACGRW
jgi:beta-glucosidase